MYERRNADWKTFCDLLRLATGEGVLEVKKVFGDDLKAAWWKAREVEVEALGACLSAAETAKGRRRTNAILPDGENTVSNSAE